MLWKFAGVGWGGGGSSGEGEEGLLIETLPESPDGVRGEGLPHCHYLPKRFVQDRCGITLQSSWPNERNEGVSRCWPVGKEETVCWETPLFIQKIQDRKVSFWHWTLLYLDVGLGTSVPETATSELERTYVLDGITGPRGVPTRTHPSF